MILNEILQWLVIVWAIWAIHNLGYAIKSLANSMTEICKWEQERIDKK